MGFSLALFATILATILATGAAIVGIVYFLLRDFRNDIIKQIDLFEKRMEKRITNFENRMEKRMIDFEKRMIDSEKRFEQRIIFFALTERRIEDALLEERIKKKVSNHYTSLLSLRERRSNAGFGQEQL